MARPVTMGVVSYKCSRPAGAADQETNNNLRITQYDDRRGLQYSDENGNVWIGRKNRCDQQLHSKTNGWPSPSRQTRWFPVVRHALLIFVLLEEYSMTRPAAVTEKRRLFNLMSHQISRMTPTNKTPCFLLIPYIRVCIRIESTERRHEDVYTSCSRYIRM